MGLRSDLTNIANAIRAKNGLSISYHISEMASAIADIPSGGGGDFDWGKIIDQTVSQVYHPSVSFIKLYTFYNCQNLTTASFPMVISTGTSAFAVCSSLTTISMPLIQTIAPYTFQSCVSLQEAILPSVTSVYSNAFFGCSALSTVSLGQISSIYTSTFTYCSNLKSLYLNVSRVPTLVLAAFNGTPLSNYTTNGVGSIFVPSSLLTQFKGTANWSRISARIFGYSFT